MYRAAAGYPKPDRRREEAARTFFSSERVFVAKVLNPSFFFCPVQERRQHLEESEEKNFLFREKTTQVFLFFSLAAATMEGSSGSNLGLIAAEKH